jgi:hypothetical protein
MNPRAIIKQLKKQGKSLDGAHWIEYTGSEPTSHVYIVDCTEIGSYIFLPDSDSYLHRPRRSNPKDNNLALIHKFFSTEANVRNYIESQSGAK